MKSLCFQDFPPTIISPLLDHSGQHTITRKDQPTLKIKSSPSPTRPRHCGVFRFCQLGAAQELSSCWIPSLLFLSAIPFWLPLYQVSSVTVTNSVHGAISDCQPWPSFSGPGSRWDKVKCFLLLGMSSWLAFQDSISLNFPSASLASLSASSAGPSYSPWLQRGLQGQSLDL